MLNQVISHKKEGGEAIPDAKHGPIDNLIQAVSTHQESCIRDSEGPESSQTKGQEVGELAVVDLRAVV